MKIHEVVIQGNFGKGAANPDVDIPQGYDSFYAKKIGNNGGMIIGVKSDGSEYKISTTSDIRLADALAKEYNSGGTADTGMQKLSMTQAFGTTGLNAIKDVGAEIIEKPSYYSYIQKRAPIDELQFKKIQKRLGHEIPEYTTQEVFGKFVNDQDDSASHPLNTVKWFPEEETFVLKFQTGSRYLVDTTGARSYIRNWAYLNF
jgi:hypothetical protein